MNKDLIDLRKKNLENLTNKITKKLPERPFHFPEN